MDIRRAQRQPAQECMSILAQDKNNFIDQCKFLGIYNDKEVYLYISSKYKSARLFHTPNYYYLPQWVEPDKLTFMQAVKIINYRLKRNNYDNFKPENINIDELIEETKEKE